MSNLHYSVVSLVASATAEPSDVNRTFENFKQLLTDSAQATEEERNEALTSLEPVIGVADLPSAAIVALGCGGLVELGADPEIACVVIAGRLKEYVGLVSASPDVNLENDQLFQFFSMPLITMLSRAAKSRKLMRDDVAFRQDIESIAPESSVAGFLHDILNVLDDEEILVLHPGLQKGYWIKISGVSDNFQLHTLLADALIGDPLQGWLPGEKPTPAVVAAARDAARSEGTTVTATGLFNWISWRGLQSDGSLDPSQDSSEHWIWLEGKPADIPAFEGKRVILLAPPSYLRSWSAERRFRDLKPTVEVLKILSPEEVKSWLARIAGANTVQQN